ncbi:MAG: cysteine hydrolase [Gammaproteobacteria bacterium]|nr:cysteine hydrolase [Gammaproteobacteria bacterium]
MDRHAIATIPLAGDVALREQAVDPASSALLLVDLQNGQCGTDARAAHPTRAGFFDRVQEVVVPAGRRLIHACRAARAEVIYTVIESLTLDGRDRGLDHKISGIFAAKGSWEAQVIEPLAPSDNDIVIPKTSSSLFNSTGFDHVLRNLGIESLMVMGVVTDQCVETTVRDGCDHGYLMTLVEDGCAAWSPERHAESLLGLKGYCRVRTSRQLVAEIAAAG